MTEKKKTKTKTRTSRYIQYVLSYAQNLKERVLRTLGSYRTYLNDSVQLIIHNITFDHCSTNFATKLCVSRGREQQRGFEGLASVLCAVILLFQPKSTRRVCTLHIYSVCVLQTRGMHVCTRLMRLRNANKLRASESCAAVCCGSQPSVVRVRQYVVKVPVKH